MKRALATCDLRASLSAESPTIIILIKSEKGLTARLEIRDPKLELFNVRDGPGTLTKLERTEGFRSVTKPPSEDWRQLVRRK